MKEEEGLGLGMRLALKVAMKSVSSSVVEDIVAEAFKADTNDDDEIDLDEWKNAAKNGEQPIKLFLI